MHTAKPPPADDRGSQIALVFALTAQRLSIYYEHAKWLSDAQGASMVADWLGRTQRVLPPARRRELAALSDRLAREIAAGLSREAGLYTAHEMMEALDANYRSDLAQAMMLECERLVDEASAAHASSGADSPHVGSAP